MSRKVSHTFFNIFCVIWLSVAANRKVKHSTFTFPTPVVELLHPTGFQVSIPDITNIMAFEFQGNINKDFEIINNTYSEGKLSGWIQKRDQRHYAYINRDTVFTDNDTVYFWLAIHFHNATSIYLYNQTFSVHVPKEYFRYLVYNDSRVG